MDYLLEYLNHNLVDPYVFAVDPALPKPEVTSYGPLRLFTVLWLFLYVSSLFVYFVFCGLSYWLFFTPSPAVLRKRAARREAEAAGQTTTKKKKKKALVSFNECDNVAYFRDVEDPHQIRNEIIVSVWSLAVMSALTCPFELLMLYGYGHIYHDIADYGMLYLVLSPVLFVIFTDSLIYWIHRILHWKSIYPLHKLHHKYKETTPWSAFSFHPLDGVAQSIPYHLFPMFFPMHNVLYAVVLGIVGLWTINIHDRVTLHLWGVNGAAHHTLHHTKFNYNFGQYFTFWDRICGTYMDPLEHAPYNPSAEPLVALEPTSRFASSAFSWDDDDIVVRKQK
jgi:lathosterol oxidase